MKIHKLAREKPKSRPAWQGCHIQSHSDSSISRKSSTPSSTLNLTPGSSSASPWILTRHGSESFQPHPAPHNFLSSTWGGMESLDAPRSENESHTDYSLLSADNRTVMGSYDISEQELGESPWAWLRDTDLTDARSGVQPLTNEPNNSFLFVPSEQAIVASHSAPDSTIRGSSLIIPVCLPPSLNQAPLGMLPDLGTQDRQQAKRKRDEDDAESRTQTRKLRDVGACLRCRIYKEKVPSTRQDLYGWSGDADLFAVRPQCALWPLRPGCWKCKAVQAALPKG